MDEMYSPVVAQQLRLRGHDAVSVNEPAYQRLAGAADAEVYAAALAQRRVLVTENVSDFHRLEAAALGAGEPNAVLVFTTNRQFARGSAVTAGRLVKALDALLTRGVEIGSAHFLEPVD